MIGTQLKSNLLTIMCEILTEVLCRQDVGEKEKQKQNRVGIKIKMNMKHLLHRKYKYISFLYYHHLKKGTYHTMTQVFLCP